MINYSEVWIDKDARIDVEDLRYNRRRFRSDLRIRVSWLYQLPFYLAYPVNAR